MTEYTEWEQDGRFGLSYREEHDPTDGSLGMGDSLITVRFESAEGRWYYKQARECGKQAKKTAWELDCLKRDLANILNKRDIRKRIRASLGEK